MFLSLRIEPKDPDLARATRTQTFQDFDRRCLARAIWSKQSEDFTGMHVEIDPAHGIDFAVRLVKIVYHKDECGERSFSFIKRVTNRNENQTFEERTVRSRCRRS